MKKKMEIKIKTVQHGIHNVHILLCNTKKQIQFLKAGMSYIWFPWYVTGLTFCDHVVHSSISHIVTCATFFLFAYKIVLKKIYNFIRQNIAIFIYKNVLGKNYLRSCDCKSNIQLYNSRLKLFFFHYFLFLVKTHKNVL